MTKFNHQPALLLNLVVLAFVFCGLLFLPFPEWVKAAVAVVACVGAYFVSLARARTLQDRREKEAETEATLPAVDPIASPALEVSQTLTPVLDVPSSFRADPDEVEKGRLLEAVFDVVGTWKGADFVPFQENLKLVKAATDFIQENVYRSFEIADNLAGTAKNAFDLSEQVQHGVNVVTNALAQSLVQTNVLFEHSKKIAMILEIMSEVSEKIHILSINASIVSARAGVLGKGFDVVAKEIRTLAKETEHSLLDIEQVISELQKTIGTVIHVVREASAETEEEKNSLIAVAGSLQGVILGVEIIRAVSGVAKEKTEEQAQLVHRLIETSTSSQGYELSAIDELKSRFQALKSKE